MGPLRDKGSLTVTGSDWGPEKMEQMAGQGEEVAWRPGWTEGRASSGDVDHCALSLQLCVKWRAAEGIMVQTYLLVLDKKKK